jgi:hypothetical protein
MTIQDRQFEESSFNNQQINPIKNQENSSFDNFGRRFNKK